MIKASWSL